MISYFINDSNDSKETSMFWIQDLKNMYEAFQNSNIIKKSSESTYNEWFLLFIILRLIQFQECEDEQSWYEFCEEIMHSHRFFPQHEIFDKIEEIAPYVTITIDANSVLYRCRCYGIEDFYSNEFVKDCLSYIKDELPDLSLDESDFRSYAKIETILSYLLLKPGILDRIKEKYMTLKEKHDSFWGFSATESDAPPESKTADMRANPRGIPYLYASEDIDTAMIEMRPQLGQVYNVATIKTKGEVKIFDFTKENIGEPTEKRMFSLRVLDNMFSIPNYGDPFEYLPTQCICEYIKLLGYDGIRFNSSLIQGGKNLVLFDVNKDAKKYLVDGSEVYVVNKIKIDYSRVLPLPEEVEKQWEE